MPMFWLLTFDDVLFWICVLRMQTGTGIPCKALVGQKEEDQKVHPINWNDHKLHLEL